MERFGAPRIASQTGKREHVGHDFHRRLIARHDLRRVELEVGRGDLRLEAAPVLSRLRHGFEVESLPGQLGIGGRGRGDFGPLDDVVAPDRDVGLGLEATGGEGPHEGLLLGLGRHQRRNQAVGDDLPWHHRREQRQHRAAITSSHHRTARPHRPHRPHPAHLELTLPLCRAARGSPPSHVGWVGALAPLLLLFVFVLVVFLRHLRLLHHHPLIGILGNGDHRPAWPDPEIDHREHFRSRPLCLFVGDRRVEDPRRRRRGDDVLAPRLDLLGEARPLRRLCWGALGVADVLHCPPGHLDDHRGKLVALRLLGPHGVDAAPNEGAGQRPK